MLAKLALFALGMLMTLTMLVAYACVRVSPDCESE
jgi:hypothetical protein